MHRMVGWGPPLVWWVFVGWMGLHPVTSGPKDLEVSGIVCALSDSTAMGKTVLYSPCMQGCGA